ncbi:putative colanic acid biosysnthesis UDP-glucose lipid carrier transferase [Flavobacterium micromati]|uniref:Putative colanic acid biosysnthesis UDP-glucose lipid carrier transferase n=1 Tax=Flavobacterium micromati TaxID=229205 RepID=A0A1M5JK27_9FLAO|nr:exopolysaccharide biosynthesis polyprenyl glycosylphosphotransferase [Flavobacterium micromati]MCL6460959.1 exopolysaccharide biosynthesis polyprenyl glycosylphosphotransferase [Flavobacterium micromati]SHG40946.1 putative colanic acid biosysnthesis UDP-glucose lipid carrier transferase [Flavobacterium micromati]
MRNRHKLTFIFFCAIADMIAMVIGTLIFINFNAKVNTGWNDLFLDKMIAITFLSWLFSVTYFKLYRVDSLFNLEDFFSNSWRALLLQRILWHGYIFIFQDDLLNLYWTKAKLFPLCFLLIYFLLSRILFMLIREKTKKSFFKPYKVAIWGFNKTSIELASHLETNSFFIEFVGILNENSTTTYSNNKDFSLELSEAILNAHANNINEMYIVSSPDLIDDLNYFFQLGDRHCMRLKFVPDFSLISKKHFSSSHLNNFHVINPRFEPLQNTYNRLIKRIYDLIFSILVIILIMSWLYPIVAYFIRKQSKGPVLFKQIRTGKKNEPFYCYKFRSMYIDGADESQQAKKGDLRVTPVGKFLRKTSLDEMPQFFNVLAGNMSVVGPRPHMLKHTSDYNCHIENFMVRHFVKPGITGLAQVSGLRGETKEVSDMKRRVSTDIQYLQSWSIIKDIKICFLTIIVTLKGDKNAF